MAKVRSGSKTFIDPAGIVEQHYIGQQTPESILRALKDLEAYVKKAAKLNKPVLILADVSLVPKIDLSKRMIEVRKAGIETMRSIKFRRAAVYGPLKVQVLVNTMALISGKQDKLKVFGNRVKAVAWLKKGIYGK